MSVEFSNSMRDLLIEHLDQQAVIVPQGVSEMKRSRKRGVPYVRNHAGNRKQSHDSLLRRGYIRFDGAMPPCTVLTDQGRWALASALAEWAEALSRINLMIDDLRPVPDEPMASAFYRALRALPRKPQRLLEQVANIPAE